MAEVPINIVVEDDLSEALCYKIMLSSSVTYHIGATYGKCGYGYIRKKISGFNNAAKGTPFLVLADLEDDCAPKQISEWFTIPKHHNLLFRIAVREIESWLLADRTGFASFLNIRKKLIPVNPDKINDPKRLLINLVKKSPKRTLRQAIVPSPGKTAKIGPDYNGQLSLFIFNSWNITEAMENSESLRRAVNSLNRFQPI